MIPFKSDWVDDISPIKSTLGGDSKADDKKEKKKKRILFKETITNRHLKSINSVLREREKEREKERILRREKVKTEGFNALKRYFELISLGVCRNGRRRL